MIWTGNGCYIWQVKMITGKYAPNTPAGWEQAARYVQEVGLNLVPVKVADGITRFNLTKNDTGWSDDILDGLFATFKAKGIKAGGWQYVYGRAPVGEAELAVKQIKRFGLEYFVIDAEVQYKESGAGPAKVYMDILMKACPEVKFALSSFRFPTLHPEFPWRAFLDPLRIGTDAHMPQVYWEQVYDPPNALNPAAQMLRSYVELTALKKLDMLPVGAAYGQDYEKMPYWSPSLAQQEAFARKAQELGCKGISWWELGTMLRPEFLARGYYGSMPKYSAMFGPSPQPSPGGEGEEEFSDAEKLDRLWKAHPELH